VQTLNLPYYDFSLRFENERQYIFDIFRKKYVQLTPEEFVRQSFAMYLVREKGYPESLIMTEQSLQLNTLTKRCDILVHKPAGTPVVLVECKAPGVKIGNDTFDQVARYNMVFNVKYLMLTNGMKHFCCLVNFDSREVSFLDSIPPYDALD